VKSPVLYNAKYSINAPANVGVVRSPMERDMTKTVAMLLIALVIAASGVALARYAEADDAPGGVVIGWVLVLGAVALGARAFLRRQS
jgi:hypothetical protein